MAERIFTPEQEAWINEQNARAIGKEPPPIVAPADRAKAVLADWLSDAEIIGRRADDVAADAVEALTTAGLRVVSAESGAGPDGLAVRKPTSYSQASVNEMRLSPERVVSASAAPEMADFLDDLAKIVTPSGADKLWEWAATAKGEIMRLSAALQAAERERDIEARNCADNADLAGRWIAEHDRQKERAEAAEARAKELEAALRQWTGWAEQNQKYIDSCTTMSAIHGAPYGGKP